MTTLSNFLECFIVLFFFLLKTEVRESGGQYALLLLID